MSAANFTLVTIVQAFFTAAATVAFLGCQQTVVASAQKLHQISRSQKTSLAHYFLFGAIGRKSVDLRDYCTPGQVDAVAISGDSATISVTIATLGIYAPRRLTVTCSGTIAP